MVSPVKVLLFFYCVFVGCINTEETRDDSSVEKTARTDDVKLPEIEIVVKTYARAEVVKKSEPKYNKEIKVNSNKLSNDITSQENGKVIRASDTQQANGESRKDIRENTQKEIPSKNSFLTSSIEKISDIASSAWDYVTNTEKKKDDLMHDLPRSDVVKDADAPLKRGTYDAPDDNDVYFDDEEVNKAEESNTEFQKDSDKSEVYKPQSDNKGDKNISDKTKENMTMKVNEGSINTTKGDSLGSLNRASVDNQSSTQKEDNEISFAMEGDNGSSLFQADEPMWWNPFRVQTTLVPEHKLADAGPEDNEMDADSGSAATTVPGYDELDSDHIQIYRPQVAHSGSRPAAETDLITLEVDKLIGHYHTCDTCMANIYNQSHYCQFYTNEADEFDKWAKYYTDILKYGCPGQNYKIKNRCCHRPHQIPQRTMQEINKLVKSAFQVMVQQCQKCPVDCEWSEWGRWSDCPSACDRQGYKNRTRTQLAAQYGGRSCPGDYIEYERCLPPHKEQGVWQQWSSWTQCSGSCGGSRHRSRKCTEPTSISCFIPCEDSVHGHFQVEPCGELNTNCCHPRQWSSWSQWSDCNIVDSSSSQIRRQRRWRSCEADQLYIDQPMCPQPCPGDESQIQDCCIPAAWAQWGAWSECIGAESVVDLETGRPCGKGCSNRTRNCDPGTCPDDICYGDHIERYFCNLEPCCVPPVWTQWCPWSECSATSGSGVRRRTRLCQADPKNWRNTTCQAGGCYGQPDSSEVEDCQGKCRNCVPPTWSNWGRWSECVPHLTYHRRTSTRYCIKSWEPECRHLECLGESTREERCVCERPTWSSWGEWGPCDQQAILPVRLRYRECRQPSNPSYCRAESCIGDSVDSQRCCAYPSWSQWSPWSQCEQHLTGRRRTSSRRCLKSSDPECIHLECFGESTREERCSCTPQQWTTWTEWSVCEWANGQSVNSRFRFCNSPDPGCPNEPCQGEGRQTKKCEPPERDCDPGNWGSWSAWGSCECVSKRRSKTRSKYSLTRSNICPPLKDTQTESCLCPDCMDNCTGRVDGKYPSCISGCRHYFTCCQGIPIPEECSGSQHYDSLCQKCTKPPSSTCTNGQSDKYKKELTIPYKKPNECRD